jgi:hypothetical protein
VYNGIEHLLHDDYMSDYPGKTYHRHVGVSNWLTNHPEVTHWVSVDDYLLPLPNFVHVQFKWGIGIDEYEAMEKFLK